MSATPVIAGFHACNNHAPTGKDKDIIRMTEAGAITFLTGMGQNFSVDDVKWVLSINPDCHFFLREYLDPRRIGDKNDRSTWDYNVLHTYFNECKSTIAKYYYTIPSGQMHFQIFNEPNMPTWAQWEGFGDTPDDMKRFNEWFVRGVNTLSSFAHSINYGLTPLTPGNRDVWFAGDDMLVDYYLHGQEVTWTNPTIGSIKTAIASCLCKEAINIADEYYFHVYIHEDAHDVSDIAYGRRFIRYLRFLQQKPFWLLECGYPNATMWKGDARLLDWFEVLNLQGFGTLDAKHRPDGVTFWILGEKEDWGNMFAPGGQIRPFVYDLKKYVDAHEEIFTPTPEPEPEPSTEIEINPQHYPYDARGFGEYLADKEPFTEITQVFIHHTVNPTPETWRGRESMLAMKRVYEQKGWTAGPHIFVAPDGIWVFTPITKQGIGVKGHNENSIHIEIVGNYEENTLDGVMLRNAIDAFSAVCNWLQYDPMDLCFHRDYAETKCPGRNINSWFKIAALGGLLACEAAKRIGSAPIRVNNDAALYKESRRTVSGAPLTNEFEVCGRIVQGFARFVLSAIKDDWLHIIRTAW